MWTEARRRQHLAHGEAEQPTARTEGRGPRHRLRVGAGRRRLLDLKCLCRCPLVVRDAIGAARFAAEPVRPLFHSAAGNRISAHHVYTGQRTGLLELTDADIGDVALSDDGRRPLALNRAKGQIVVVDLDNFAVLRRYGSSQL